MPIIFISYRRDDAPGYAGRLYDRVLREFGRDNVFIDVDALQPGDDFVDAIREKLEKCDLMLALIGKRWLTATDDHGRLRLEDEGDYVRIEIQTALDRRLRTIPVLVERAAMPRLQDLPEPLRPLARRQAIELSDTRWEYDVGTLVEHLKRVAAGQAAAATPTLAPMPSNARDAQIASAAAPDRAAQPRLQTDRREEEAATRRAQEDARRREEIEAAAVRAQEEERKRAETEVKAAAARAREDERRAMEAKAERAREDERKRLAAEAETTRLRAQEQKRLDAEAEAAAARAVEAERKKAEATANKAAEHARAEERERLDAAAQRARKEDQIGLEAEAALARARIEDEGRPGKETGAAADLMQPGERAGNSGTPWSTPVVALSIAAFGTAIISALQAYPEVLGRLPPALPNLLTSVLMLGIAVVRREAPRQYRRLIAAGFLVQAIRELLFLAAPTADTYTVGELLRLCAYGCWIAAFTQRGAVRLSPRIVPYVVAAIAIVALQWPWMRDPLLSALRPLTLAGMAWTVFEVSRESKYSSLRWAVWGTSIWLAAGGYYWIGMAALDYYSNPHLEASSSFFVDVARWLIAMSVRNESQRHPSPSNDQQQVAGSIQSAP